MLISELIEKIELILTDSDLKKAKADEKSAEEWLKEAIKGFTEFGVEKELSVEILKKFLKLNPIVTDEAGSFYEFKNTNSRVDKEENTNDGVSEIFYLMEKEQVSCLHRLNTTEIWRWVAGCDVLLYIFAEEEVLTVTLNEKNPAYTIPKGKLFGAINSDSTSFGLVICECRPGFMIDDYNNPTLENLAELLKQYAGNKEIMGSLKKLISEPQFVELFRQYFQNKEVTNILKTLFEPQKGLESSLSQLFKSSKIKEVVDQENSQKNHKCLIL